MYYENYADIGTVHAVKVYHSGFVSERFWLHPRFEGSEYRFDNLYDACRWLGRDAAQAYSDRPASPFVWAFYDELGLRIPAEVIRHFAGITKYPRRKYYWRGYGKYTFRQGPVEGIRCWRGGYHGDRMIRTTQEIRENDFLNYDEDCLEYGIKVRPNRRRTSIPNYYDDPRFSRRGDNWKHYRKTRWK